MKAYCIYVMKNKSHGVVSKNLSKIKLSEEAATMIAESVNILYQSMVSRKIKEMQEEMKNKDGGRSYAKFKGI